MRNVDCTLYQLCMRAHFTERRTLKTLAYEYIPGTFMHMKPPCIMCSEDVDFLCKCLNLLYLIKELILCDLVIHRWHICSF